MRKGKLHENRQVRWGAVPWRMLMEAVSARRTRAAASAGRVTVFTAVTGGVAPRPAPGGHDTVPATRTTAGCLNFVSSPTVCRSCFWHAITRPDLRDAAVLRHAFVGACMLPLAPILLESLLQGLTLGLGWLEAFRRRGQPKSSKWFRSRYLCWSERDCEFTTRIGGILADHAR